MNKRYKKAISLIALTVTIATSIVLISVVLIGLNNTDIFNNAQSAGEKTEVAEEKEVINSAIVLAKVGGGGGKLTLKNLENRLKKYNVELFEEMGIIIVRFLDSNRSYEVTQKGKITQVELGERKVLTLQCVNSAGTVIGQKEYFLYNSSYYIEPLQVEGYECAVKTLTGEITENKTIKQTYYMLFDDDETLVFSGLNSSGAITTTESEIVSYMVGNNTTTSGNGLLEKTIQGVLRVPETYNGKPVSNIGQYAFKGTKNILEVSTGNGVAVIGNVAFDNCINVQNITIGKKVENLNGNTFKACPKLLTFTVESEEPGLIFNCFYNTAFTNIKVNANNPTYKLIDGMLCSIDGKILYLIPTGMGGTITIPQGVETIFDYACSYNKKINKLIMSDSVTTIRMQAFMSCTNLEQITIGKNVSSIAGHAFRDCSNFTTLNMYSEKALSFHCFLNCSKFTTINVSENNETYKLIDGMLCSADGKTLYLIPKGMGGTVTIPQGVETIYNYAGEYNTNVTKIILSSTVTNINAQAFDSCTNMQEIVIGEKVTNIVSHVFRSCNSLVTVVIDSATIASKLTSQTIYGNLINKATTIYIKDGITNIGSYVLSNYTAQPETDRTGYTKYVKN